MAPLIAMIAGKVIGRLFNKDKPESKTQQATAVSVPVATAAALMLIQDGEPTMQFLGAVLMAVSAGLLIYKDGNDDG